MKKFTKFMALMLVVALSVTAFAGCGQKQESNTFKIGGIGPTTGGAAVYGQSVKEGAELAVKEINAAGGINGTQIEFFFEDDEADPEKSVNAYNTLKDKGMQVLMGTVTTGACLAVIEETKEDNMFQLTPSASSSSATVNDNAFQICFSDPNMGIISADYIADNKVASKVAVIYDSSDAYSTGIYNAFKTQAAAKSLEIVSEKSFDASNNTDFSVQVSAAKSAGAELIFLPIYYSEASKIINEAKKTEYSPMFFGCDGLDGILTIEGFDASLAENVMLLAPFSETEESAASFVESYKADYNKTPTQFAADAYDAIYIIKKLLENSKVTTDSSVSDICEALKAEIVNLSYDGVTGKAMTWKATGEVEKTPKIYRIESGKYNQIG